MLCSVLQFPTYTVDVVQSINVTNHYKFHGKDFIFEFWEFHLYLQVMVKQHFV